MFISFSLIPLIVIRYLFFPSFSQEFQSPQKIKSKIHHEIVVTATRLETQAFKIGNSVTVVTAEELRQRGFLTVAEALPYLALGFLTRNGGPGAAASFMMRGSNSEHTLVLIDGIEINDPITPSRSCDLSHLFLADVDRLEIIEGPQSPLYGSDAMGGIINIILKKKADRKFSLNSEVGSFQTMNLNLSVAGEVKQLSYHLSASGFKTQGISSASSFYPGNQEKDGYWNTTFSSFLTYQLSSSTNFDCFVRYVNSRTELDNFGGPYGDDPNNIQRWRTSLFKFNFRTIQLNQLWEQKIFFAFMTNNRRNHNDEDNFHPLEKENGKFASFFFKLDWQNNLHFQPNHILTLGVEAEKEMGESTYFWSSPWGEDKSIFPSKESFSASFYLQEHFSLSPSLFSTVGLRLDHHSRSGLALTYRLAQSFWLEKTSTKLRASLATGFKNPSLYQLYAPPSMWGPIGNPELKPEKSLAWDVGFEQTFPGFLKTISLNYFRHFFRHLIQFNYLEGYQNIGRAKMVGIRGQGEISLASFLNLNLVLSWLEALDLSSQQKLLRRPNFQGKIEIQFNPTSHWKVLTTIWKVGSRDDLDYSLWPAKRTNLPAFYLVNANLIYQPRASFSCHLRLENITNCRYELVKGYGTPGFGFYTGFSFTF
ncbi:MAG: TonB-dependent receptor [Candidatus Aminicenantes bacterium]|nr:TonB-dependent receptor [Candidatus Aminicenantes bacterium]